MGKENTGKLHKPSTEDGGNTYSSVISELKEFREFFVENVDAEGPYVYIYDDPDWETEDGGPVVRMVKGRLSVKQSMRPILCLFTREDMNGIYPWTKNNFERENGILELFNLWQYTNGTYLGGEIFDFNARWYINNEMAETLENWAQKIEDAIKPLSHIKENAKICEKLSSIMRNNEHKWMPCYVQWSYIEKIDIFIKNLDQPDKIPDQDTLGNDVNDKSSQKKEVSRSNIKGMSWKEAKAQAEKYVKKHGYPGLGKLTEIVGCSPNTLRKAIERSEILCSAKREYDHQRKVPKAVALTEKILAKTKQTTEKSPESLAKEDVIKVLYEKATPEELKKLEAMSTEELKNLVSLYGEQFDDDNQDDLQKARRRRKV